MECELTLSAQRKLNANLKELKRRKDKERFEYDFPYYAEKCLVIRPKDGGKIPFVLNRAQRYTHSKIEDQLKETGKIRALWLKGRQQGLSTYGEGRFYWRTSRQKGKRAFILTHEQDATSNLFEMAKRYHNNCPKEERPELDTSNAKELIFSDIDSGYKIGTAGNKEVGRSQTNQYFHGSEVAFWKNAENLTKGILQTIPDMPGTEVIYESTANGVGNFFHQQWQLAEAGKSEFIAIFIPWFWQDEYEADLPKDFKLTPDEEDILDQYPEMNKRKIYWRRKKIISLSVSGADGEESFKQEYPMNAAEAFRYSGVNGLIKPGIVMKARKQDLPNQYAPLVIGVDPARGGDDTAIIRREGRVAYKLQYDNNDDLMHVVGLCVQIIREEMPAKMFIDVGGIGAGVYDRLVELGYGDTVVAVNFGSTKSVTDQRKYYNKRDEMWGEMSNWLKDEPSQIPDNDRLQMELVALEYKYNSNGQMKTEPKEDMKKRIGSSPDGGDALALTFAFPVANDIDHYYDESWNKPEGRNKRGGY
jgi:hypothetical protein